VQNGTLINNSAYLNDKNGIYLYNSTSNLIAINNASGNKLHGIVLDYSDKDNIVDNNDVCSNENSGIVLSASNLHTILNNTFNFNAKFGVFLKSSSDSNTIANNNVSDNGFGPDLDKGGIWLESGSDNNIINNNTVSNNINWGFHLKENSDSNRIYHNNIFNNTINASDDSTNIWDNDYPSGGNYWGDYPGPDAYSGPGQNMSGSDGIGDWPFGITGGGNEDEYPLINPYVERISPYAIGWVPNGTDASIVADIIIEWNETMNWTSIEEAFGLTEGNNSYNSTNGSWFHNATNNMSIFSLNNMTFAYETEYRVTVNYSATDVNGNLLDQNKNSVFDGWPGDALVWNFTTGDAPPVVVSTIPGNGTLGINPEKPMQITFSEEMDPASVNIAFSYSNGSFSWTGLDGTIGWNAIGNVMTFTPFNFLQNNTTYVVFLDGSIAMGVDGNLLDGNDDGVQGGNYSWWFVTWLEPPLPQVTNTFPPDGASNIGINTHINMAFDVEMNTTSVVGAFSYSNSTDVWDASDGVVEWFNNDTYFSFLPTHPLDYDQTYTVTLNATAASTYGQTLDGDYNGVANPGDDFNFTFSTASRPPVVVSAYPLNGQINVAVNLSEIFINFSKSMNTISVINALTISPAVGFTYQWSGSNQNLTLLLNSVLMNGTQYWVTITTFAMDLQGIQLDGDKDGIAGGGSFVFNFITVGAPELDFVEIVDWYPRNNRSVSADTFPGVGIEFNNQMIRASVETRFTLRNSSNVVVNGTFVWDGSSMIVVFVPNVTLEYNMTYHVLLAAGSEDVNGNSIGEAFSWQFYTNAEEAKSLLDEDWWLYVIVVALVFLVLGLLLNNRGIRGELRKARVENKKLKRELKKKRTNLDMGREETTIVGDEAETTETTGEEPPLEEAVENVERTEPNSDPGAIV
jgi:parallel beta-helix repeat protein